MNQELKQQIIVRLGLTELDEIQQEAVFADIGETILRQIVLDVHDVLPLERHAELKEVLQKNDFDELYALLTSTGIDFTEIMKKSADTVMADLV
jgi:tRNA(Leu) C34 or U34 (ribose-2'-O)-methylase TrmL